MQQNKDGTLTKKPKKFAGLEVIVSLSLATLIIVIGWVGVFGIGVGDDADAEAGSGVVAEQTVDDADEVADNEATEEGSTIVLPELENGSTILIGVGIIAIVAAGGFGVWYFVNKRKQDAKRYQDEQNALAADRQKAEANWKQYEALHDELEDKVYNAETDWDILFFYPAINDHTVKETQDLRFAQSAANRLDRTPPSYLTPETQITDLPYPKAVREFEKAWNIAWANAKQVKQSALSVDERKTIDNIMRMLSMARDTASSENEKQMAFKRIDALISELNTINVPERAQELLAQEQRKVLASPEVADMDDADLPTVNELLANQDQAESKQGERVR